MNQKADHVVRLLARLRRLASLSDEDMRVMELLHDMFAPWAPVPLEKLHFKKPAGVKITAPEIVEKFRAMQNDSSFRNAAISALQAEFTAWCMFASVTELRKAAKELLDDKLARIKAKPDVIDFLCSRLLSARG